MDFYKEVLIMGLFEEQVSRKPDLYPKASEFISTMWHGSWTPDEFDFKGDISQFFFELSKEEQQIVSRTLSAIGQIEVAVKKFWSKLGDNLPHPSIADLGYVMADIEVRHNKAYEKLLSILGLEDIFEENLKEEVVAGRVKYLRKYLDKVYTDDKKQYIYALILFTLFVENVSLFSQFYIILWFKRNKNVLNDTAQQVEYTRNEENIHAQVGIWLINTLREEYPELFDEELITRIRHEAQEAFKAESAIIDWMLGDYKAEGLDADLLKEYIDHRIIISLRQIGFDVSTSGNRYDEFKWMDEELLGYQQKDFFSGKDKNYGKNNKVYDIDSLD
jgi:ribonucleoside-diphosphate reductase beta chain